MSLRIDIDIADALITERPFSVVDSALRARDPADFVGDGVWLMPGGKGVTLFPDQAAAGWPANTDKWAKADWLLDTARWEQIAKRAPGDWYLASKGYANTTGLYGGAVSPLISRAALAVNQGFAFDVYGYGVPGTVVADMLQVTFSGGLTLHVHSDGTCDLEDQRPSSIAAFGGGYLTKGQPLTADAAGTNTAGTPSNPSATSLIGKMLRVIVFPYRRGRLLIVTDQGGVLDIPTGCRVDSAGSEAGSRTQGENAYYVTTEAGQITLTPSPFVRALVAANPLTCAESLTGTLTSPVVPLPYAVAAQPSEVTGEVDAQDGSSLGLAVVDQDGNSFAPTTAARATSLKYQVSFDSPGPSVFPVLYSLEMKWARVLGDRTYNTTTVPTVHTVTGNVVSAHLTLSRDRQQKTFEFEIDNPSDHYTSLKDLYNRRMLCTFDAGGADSAFGLSGADVVTIFNGLTDAIDFTDGTASRLRVPCSGLRKRLRSYLLNDSQKFDGMLDTDTVRTLLTNAGIDESQIVIYDDGGQPLDSADPGDDPLWRPSNGQTCDEFIQHLADTFSGWIFDDIGGIYYYVPREYFVDQALVANGGLIPTVYQETPYSLGIPQTRAVNPGALVALAGSVKQTSEEPRANDIWVLGQDGDGNILSAHYEDWASINDRTAKNWIGERRTLIYASGSITTLATAQLVLAALADAFTRALVSVSFTLPDYQITQLPLDGPLVLDGFDVGLITGLSADLSNDRARISEYTYEVL